MIVAERIREEREKRGWTQGDLSKHSGTNRDTISGVESGRHRPRPSTLRKIAGAFGLEVRDLFEAADSPKAPPDVEDYLRSLDAHLSALDNDEFTRAIEARLELKTLRAMVSEMSKERARVREARAKNPDYPVVVAADKRATHRTAAVVGRWTMETFGFTREEAEEKAAEAEQVWEEVLAQ